MKSGTRDDQLLLVLICLGWVGDATIASLTFCNVSLSCLFPFIMIMYRSYPAFYNECISVAAVSKKKNFPVAVFSNSNVQVDYAGIGVDVVSMKPGGGFQEMSGACTWRSYIERPSAFWHTLARFSVLEFSPISILLLVLAHDGGFSITTAVQCTI